jgi:hypothetical protein
MKNFYAYYNEFDPSPSLRPVESGSQSLSSGTSIGVGRGGNSGFPLIQKSEPRVTRLKGFGGAINAEVARYWIESVMAI